MGTLNDNQHAFHVNNKESLYDFRLRQAVNQIYSTYGDVVSVEAKKKSLTKFGDNPSVSTAYETVAPWQGTEINETFVSTNLIDSVVSSSTSDTTQTITVEGHTIDTSGNLTFVVQSVALTGRTETPLITPLARANRAYVAASGTFNTTPAALVGIVSIYDNTGGMASGVPSVAAATKLRIAAGDTQSQKCATSVSSTDYWIITHASVDIGDTTGNAAFVTAQLEIRDVANGGAWRPMGRVFTLWADQPGFDRAYNPYLIVPKNHDFRVSAKANANLAEVYANVDGYLASVVT